MVSQAAFAGELFPKVVVTPSPLKPYVDEIMRGLGESQSLLRPGQDAHDFTLSPSQAKMLAEADVLIVSDMGMNPMLKRLMAKNKRTRIIQLSNLDGSAPLPYTEENPWLEAIKTQSGITGTDEEHDEHEEHEASAEPSLDPHLWLDPERMAATARSLAIALSKISPEAKPTLTENADTLATHLRQEVIPKLRQMLTKPIRTTNAVSQPELPFITYHAAYLYFLERFNLAHTGEITIRPEQTMGAKTVATLMQKAETTRVRCLIGEQKTTLMERVAKATGAKIIILSPEQLPNRADVDALDWLQNDYDRFLYVTAKTFAGCL